MPPVSSTTMEPTTTCAPSDLGPIVLSDLMLGGCATESFTSAALEPGDGAHQLVLRRGKSVVKSVTVRDDVAVGIAARIAASANIELLPERALGGNVARLAVKVGQRSAQVMISLVASASGFFVEVHSLAAEAQRARASRAALRRCPKCSSLHAPNIDRCDADGSQLIDVRDLAETGGTIGPYRVGSLLGKGGMGAVFEASHALLEREVAIKLMKDSLGRDSAAERRFLFEARLASRLRHARVVEVSDFGVLDDGRPFMVMERVRGIPLETYLRDQGSLEPVVAMNLGLAIAEGLSAAHSGGVVHNDLKPSNVLLVGPVTADDRLGLKLIDFGAASLIADRASNVEEFVGTPHYMSPERAQGELGDVRSDLYALGIVLFEMLTGAVPFDGAEMHHVLAAHLRDELPPLVSKFGALPKSIHRLVTRALRKHPDQRFQSAEEMVIELRAARTAAALPTWRRWLP